VLRLSSSIAIANAGCRAIERTVVWAHLLSPSYPQVDLVG
jgi:hypothetical protein